MDRKQAIAVILLALASVRTGLADRVLDRAETLALFEGRTATAHRTWIESGVIRARHWEYRPAALQDAQEVEAAVQRAVLEHRNSGSSLPLEADLRKQLLDALPFNTRYRLANESAMMSDVLLKYDGERFFWQIDVESRYDSLELPPDLSGNPMARRFSLASNRHRTFVWDGQEYTLISGNTGSAVVDATGRIPRAVGGPLTAAVIPWGHGLLSPADLETAKSYVVERTEDSQRQLHLTLLTGNGTEIQMILLPDKDYAPSYWRLAPVAEAVLTAACSQYLLAAGRWVPGSIVIEEHAWDTGRLLAHDTWEIHEVQTPDLTPADFEVSYPTDCLVECFTDVADHPLQYRTSLTADTGQLRTERLMLLATKAAEPWNCATIALTYAARRLGRQLERGDYASLLHPDGTATSLLEIKQRAMDLGLHARTVRTDLRTLGGIKDCQAILHLPGQEHFVVLDAVGGGKVWILDMAADRFYYSIEAGFMGMDWPDGTALLLSNRPISLPENAVELDDTAAAGLLGGDEAYSCTKILQRPYCIYCQDAGICMGYFEYYFERCACEAALTGSCTMTLLPRYMESPCIMDPWGYGGCMPNGAWTYYNMLSCEGYCTPSQY